MEKAESFSKGWFAKNVLRENLRKRKPAKIQERLKFTTDLAEAVKDVDLVIEAVVDVLAVKRDVLAQIDALTPDRTIFASNSSYIVSSKFCDVVKHPEKVLNLHFFNPALVMKLVEVVKAPIAAKKP